MTKRTDQLKKRSGLTGGSAAGEDVKRNMVFPNGFPVPAGHTARVNKLLRSWKC